MKIKENKAYTIRGKFNTGDRWVEHATGLTELRDILDSVERNETIVSYEVYRDDTGRAVATSKDMIVEALDDAVRDGLVNCYEWAYDLVYPLVAPDV